MRNAGLEEKQARIKISRRNINKLRYAADTTLMAESEEEQKSLLMKVKQEYLMLLIFLQAVLIPACASSSPAFLMMYSAHKLNKQDDNIQP